MELARIHPQTANFLAIQETKELELKPFLQALNSPKVYESTDEEVILTLVKAVLTATHRLKREVEEDEEYEQLAGSILREVREDFHMLTLDEIKLACIRGSKGLFGEVFAISAVQILQWLGAFKVDQNRHRAKKQLILAQEVKIEPREVTDEDSKKLALNAFNRYKKTGKYEDYGNIIYHFLEKKGVINFCNQRKNEIKEAFLKMELTRLSAPLNLDEKRRFEREKNDLLNNPKDLKGMLKRHALNVFFADLCEMGTELEIPSQTGKESLNVAV